MSEIRAQLDRARYAPGQRMVLTVDHTPPAGSVLTVPAGLVVAGQSLAGELQLPAWRVRAVDPATAWTLHEQTAARSVLVAEAVRSGEVAVRLEWLGAAAEALARYVVATMVTGWCAGVRAGEGEAAAMKRQAKLYPGTGVVRVFFEPGEGLPAAAWTDTTTDLANAPAGADVIASYKDPGVDVRPFVAAWQATRRTGRLVLVPHHEPEQGTGGDPSVAVFRASWTALREQIGDHPARKAGRLLTAVCYTLVWIRRGGDWRKWWPEHEAAAVDLVLGDWYPYDPTSKTPYKPARYEPPATALAVLVDIAEKVGRPWGIGEINHARIASDSTGEACAVWYRTMHAWAAANGCVVWCHFHKSGGDLTNRLPEQQALRDLIAEG